MPASSILSQEEDQRSDRGEQTRPTQCPVIFLSQEGSTLWPGGVDSAFARIVESVKGSASSVVGLGELWADCDLRSWWDAVSIGAEQCLRILNQGRGKHYLDRFLAKKSRSGLQRQRRIREE